MAISEVGEWMAFNLPDGYTQVHTVVKRDGDGAEAQITIRVDNVYDGEVVDTKYITETAGEAMTELPEPSSADTTLSIRPTKFTLKGHEYDGVAIDVAKNGEPYQVWYVSSDIPVYGVGKRTNADGFASYEIADFGMN
ncbi:MAG: hypothetical protein LUE17_02870 [Planctomycetaceae bacterium]|nr:hypothetical protein [Planctomycetaceae bacterium]